MAFAFDSTWTRIGSPLTLLAALTCSGMVACAARAAVSGESEPPPPGLVSVGPDVWVVGDADAPDAYYESGYYWRSDNDRWYRGTAAHGPWLVVETRIVPQRVVVHERDHHPAIVARRRPQPQPVRAQAVEEKRAEQREKDAEASAQAAKRREKVATQRENTAQRDARVAEDRQEDAQHKEKVAAHNATIAERREDAAEQRQKAAEHQAQVAERRDKAAEQREAEPRREQQKNEQQKK